MTDVGRFPGEEGPVVLEAGNGPVGRTQLSIRRRNIRNLFVQRGGVAWHCCQR